MDALPESHRGWDQQKEFPCGEQLLLLLDKGEASPGRRVNGRRQAPSRGPRVGVPERAAVRSGSFRSVEGK